MKTSLTFLLLTTLLCAQPPAAPDSVVGSPATPSKDIEVQVNGSAVVELPEGFKRISVASAEIAEAVAVSPKELLLNGKAPGETSVVLWDTKGLRHSYELHVVTDEALLQGLRQQLKDEVGSDVTLTPGGPALFLRGTVQTTGAADRAYAIASACPQTKVINLLRVKVPDAQPQILLKVRFADVDKSLANQFGINLFGLNNKGVGTSTTQQFGQLPTFSQQGNQLTATLTDLLNIMYYRPDINLGAIIQDLEAKNVLQILAEPNLLTMSGHQASFLAGGEFPFPTIQGGASGVGQITIQFKEFGIRLNFLPTITPRGTIHLVVSPEVSSLDYTNGLTVSGYTIPGLATKRITTDVELQRGQSFAIAGLLNNQTVENLDRLPGFASIPVLGKLFQSRQVTKSHSELLVVVTPEIVNPMPEGSTLPAIAMKDSFLPGKIADKLGNPVGTAKPGTGTIAVEELKAIEETEAAATQAVLNTSGVLTTAPTLPTAAAGTGTAAATPAASPSATPTAASSPNK